VWRCGGRRADVESGPVETLLSFAEELERRDADVAQALLEVERLQREVEEVRVRGTAAVTRLASLPSALAELEVDERAAAAEQLEADAAARDAEAALQRARKEDERFAAERSLQRARDRARSAERWVAQIREERARLEAEGEARRAESMLLAARAAELAPLVRDVPPPSPGLEGALAWASRARGELLLERSALATERDTLVREASELLASVLGEALTTTGVAGVRARLERALHEASA
jgi:chromosome segregation ATPase